MHPYDIMIVISIACCVGFTAAIYVRKDYVLSAGYFVGATLGAFSGSTLTFWLLPWLDKPGLLLGGFGGAVLLVGLWHFARRKHDREDA